MSHHQIGLLASQPKEIMAIKTHHSEIREDNVDRIITADNYERACLAYLTTKIVNNMENYMKPPGNRSTQQIIYHVGTLYPKRWNYKLNRYVTMYINRCL